ncbi:MAG: molybdopterin oxidoreductase family protein [Rhodovibrionaceae bacterium]
MPLDAQTKPETVYSVCPHDCPSTCALEVERLSETRIGKVRGLKGHPYTDGVICAKVARYAERVHHPDRLIQPLQRVGEKGGGPKAFRPISWDDALDITAEAFLKAEARYGAETVWPYFYAGTMGHVQRDGIERLRHVKGYSRQWSTICTMLPESGWLAGVGAKQGVDAREIQDSDLIVVWGGNPVNTQVNVMSHIAKARKTRGAKLVVIDPYRTGTAEQADMFLAVRPSTDAALAAAVIHILLRDGHADRDYLAAFTDWDAAAEAHFREKTPAWASEITGLAVAQIEAFAKLYGATPRSFIRVGYGFARTRNGAANLHAVSCLPAVTGAWKHRGGGALWGNGVIYHLDKTLIDGSDRLDKSVRKLDQSRFGPVMTGDPRDIGEGPPVTALLVQNTNPAVVCPETRKCLDGLAREDLFTCVHEQFLTETAEMADIVIPATMFLEHDDYYTASGHTFLQVARKVIEPPEGCRENHWVICELARRLGAEHPGFGMSAWELIAETFRRSGHPPPEEVHDKRGHDCAVPFEEMHHLKGFPQPDGRFRFRADWAGVGRDHAGMPPLADHWTSIEQADAAQPFRLVAAPARGYLNTSFNETPGSQKREGRPALLLHPEDCAELGVEEGARLRIGNARGSLVIHLRPFDGLQRGVAVVESIHPNKAFEEGLGINLLTSADAGAPRGGAVFHDTAIWIRPA